MMIFRRFFYFFLVALNYKENPRTPSRTRLKFPPTTEGGDCGGFELNEAVVNAESFIQSVEKESRFRKK